MKSTLSPDLKARILASAKSTPSPTRKQEEWRVSLVLVASVLVSALVLGAMGERQTDYRARALLVGTLLGTSTLAAVAWLIVGRWRSMIGPSRATLVSVGIAAPLTLLVWKVLWSARFAGALDPNPRLGFRCLGVSLAIGAIPLILVLVRRRGTDPTHPRAAGFASGAAAGLVGAAFVDGWCPVGYVPHFLLGHVLPVALLALLGLFAGTRVLRLGSR